MEDGRDEVEEIVQEGKEEGHHDLMSKLPDCLLGNILDLLETKDAVKTGILSKRWQNLWTSSTNLRFDLISKLPDSLLRRIIAFLPTEEAVKTGILSKRWKNLWTCISFLDFHHRSRSSPFSLEDFVRSVSRSLSRHRGSKVHRFSLYHLDHERWVTSDVDKCIQFALEKNVQVLHVGLSRFYTENGSVEYKLPVTVFRSGSLTELIVSDCGMEAPPATVQWSSLKGLHLNRVRLSNDLLDDILSASPLLEDLDLHDCDNLSRLIVCSSRLKKFSLTPSSCLEGISAPNLEQLCLIGLQSMNDLVDHILSGCPLLEELILLSYNNDSASLSITSPSLKKFSLTSSHHVVTLVGITAPSLKELDLDGVQLGDDSLLSGFPMLEDLTLSYNRDCPSNVMPESICSPSLKRLTLKGLHSLIVISTPNIIALRITVDVPEIDNSLSILSSLATLEIEYIRNVEDNGVSCKLKKLLKHLDYATSLMMNCRTIEILSTWELQKLSAPLSTRKCLKLKTGMQKQFLPGIAALIESSPYLETLIIDMNMWMHPFLPADKFVEMHDFDAARFWESQSCSLHHLKSVNINDFWWSASCIRTDMVENFLKVQREKLMLLLFLLKNASALEEMIIRVCSGSLKFEKVEDKQKVLTAMEREIANFPSSTARAVVSFLYE